MADLNQKTPEFQPIPPEASKGEFSLEQEPILDAAKTKAQDSSRPKKTQRAVDESVVIDGALRKQFEEIRQQPDSVQREFSEKHAKLLADILNSNHPEELDAADMAALALGEDTEI